MQTYETELYHYGRLGMKWYQHIFGDADSRAKYAEAKRQVKTDKKLTGKSLGDRAYLRTLSNEDIQARINRLKLEQTYRELVTGKQTDVNKGKDSTEKTFKQLYKQEVKTLLAKKLAGLTVSRKAQKKERKVKAQIKNDIRRETERAERISAAKQAGRNARKAVNEKIGGAYDSVRSEIADGVMRYRYGIDKRAKRNDYKRSEVKWLV